jgi:hypothetical protein|tara:strand:+ start:3523 stop:4008 length:486 start_codon:yes stop_codon:yes gene_type:complete
MTDSDSTGNSDYDSGSTESKPNWRRELENRAKKAEDSQAELATKLENYERRDTFRSAGLDPDDSRVKYFVKGYDGDMDPSVIREEAMAAGFLGDNTPMPSQPNREPEWTDEMLTEARIQTAGEGGDPVIPPDFEQRIRATKNEDELKALMESQGFGWNASV